MTAVWKNIRIAICGMICGLSSITSACTSVPVNQSAPGIGKLPEPRLYKVSGLAGSLVEKGKITGVVTLVARKEKIVHSEAIGARGVDIGMSQLMGGNLLLENDLRVAVNQSIKE